jgi:hypothetical protein
MNRTIRKLQARLFTAGHHGLAALARRRTTRGLVGPLVRGLARLTRRAKAPREVSPTPTASEPGQIWQGYLPSKKAVPIVEETNEVVHAEIRTYCPLRGTGDHSACHALMGYDRALLAAHGGSFEVLRSQAEPGVEVCLVALRPGVGQDR